MLYVQIVTMKIQGVDQNSRQLSSAKYIEVSHNIKLIVCEVKN